MIRRLPLLLSLALFNCSGPDEKSAENDADAETLPFDAASDANVANDDTNGGDPDVSKPSPGPSEDGWESAYVDGAAGFSCDDEFDALSGSDVPRLEFDDTTVFVGFEQVGDNQNPLFARFDGTEQVYCTRHETEGPDGRAWGITWNGGDVAYVVYSIVGGGSALEGKGWLDAYAPGAISGGGPRVSYVGMVDTTNGALDAGTFVIAVKSDNKVNSHSPAGAVTVLEDGNVEFLGESAHKPIDADGESAMDCTDYPFDSKYVFAPDLQSLVCAECTNCTPRQPCD